MHAKICAFCFLAVLSAFGLPAVFQAQVATPTRIYDRDKWGLFGPVSKMTHSFSIFRRRGEEWVESDRRFDLELTFDREGNETGRKGDGLIGSAASPSFACRLKYVRDEKNRAKEEYEVCGDRETLVRKFSWEDDSRGNWVKKTTFVLVRDTSEFRKQSVNYRELVYFD